MRHSLRRLRTGHMLDEAGNQQVRVPSKWSLLFVPLLSGLLLACVPVEVPNADTGGVTPIVPATREPTRPPAEATPAPSTTPAASPVNCEQALPGVPTAISSRDSDSPIVTASPNPSPSSTRLTSPRDVPPPQTPAPLAIRTDLILEAQLRLLLGENLNGYGIAAIDLESGRSVSINAGLVFYSASVFKTWVMYEVYHQASLGYFKLTDELVITPYYDAFGLGPRATRLCEQLTVEEAMGAMMSISDNAAAVLLQDLVGAPNLNNSMAALGLKDSSLNTDDIPVTANDMALLLQFIASGKAVNRNASAEMASLLLSETFDNGLSAGVPREAQVAHKTGNWPNARHDIGIVFAPETTYVIAILSDNRDGSQALIQAISTAVYESFNP